MCVTFIGLIFLLVMAWAPADTEMSIHDAATVIGGGMLWLAMFMDAVLWILFMKETGGISSWSVLGMIVYSIMLSAANLCTVVPYVVMVGEVMLLPV